MRHPRRPRLALEGGLRFTGQALLELPAMKKTYDPLTEWRGKHTPYWLDKPRPDVEARMTKQINQMHMAAAIVAKEKPGEKAD